MFNSAPFPPAARRIPCGIADAGSWEGPARYAIEMLLLPLGLEPEWIDTRGRDRVGLWYAPSNRPGPTGWVHVASLFASGAEEADPDFPDPVAVAFRWLSGASERGTPRDRHGRPPHAGSAHDRLGIGARAPVDEARERLAQALSGAGVRLHPRTWDGRRWALCPTHDIDYLRKARPGILWRDVVQRMVSDPGTSLGERLARAGRLLARIPASRDPFVRALDRMARETTSRGGSATWFFKAAAHGPQDVGYRLGALRARFRVLSEAGHEIGLHPGYHAYAHPERLGWEAKALERAAGSPGVSMRTHYLRWHDTATPRAAVAAGFRIDSSLGFPDAAGFRRGTCHPFRVWDAAAGRPTDLWEMPLCMMESALFNRRGLDFRQALAAGDAFAATCRRHRGALVALWHNTLWDEDYPEWGTHFIGTLDAAVAAGASIQSLAGALATWRPG